MHTNPVEPIAKLHRSGPTDCIVCGAVMPPIKPKGRIPIYCSTRCRKAAYEARRENKPDAFEVKVVQTRTVAEHPLNTCVENTLGSPRAYRRMLQHLTEMIETDQMNDPKWDLVTTTLPALEHALTLRAARQQHHYEDQQRLLRARQDQAAQQRATQTEQARRFAADYRRQHGLPPLPGDPPR